MKRLFGRFAPDALGKHVRKRPVFPFLPENALFWALLLLLSMGSAVTLYSKVTDRQQAQAANAAPEAAEYYSEYPLTSGGVVRFYGP